MDDDGHFRVASLYDRESVMKLIEIRDEGGYQYNDLTPYDQELFKNYLIISAHAWENLIENFTQRGTLEITEI